MAHTWGKENRIRACVPPANCNGRRSRREQKKYCVSFKSLATSNHGKGKTTRKAPQSLQGPGMLYSLLGHCMRFTITGTTDVSSTSGPDGGATSAAPTANEELGGAKPNQFWTRAMMSWFWRYRYEVPIPTTKPMNSGENRRGPGKRFRLWRRRWWRRKSNGRITIASCERWYLHHNFKVNTKHPIIFPRRVYVFDWLMIEEKKKKKKNDIIFPLLV